jgi:hypothetical protein
VCRTAGGRDWGASAGICMHQGHQRRLGGVAPRSGVLCAVVVLQDSMTAAADAALLERIAKIMSYIKLNAGGGWRGLGCLVPIPSPACVTLHGSQAVWQLALFGRAPPGPVPGADPQPRLCHPAGQPGCMAAACPIGRAPPARVPLQARRTPSAPRSSRTSSRPCWRAGTPKPRAMCRCGAAGGKLRRGAGCWGAARLWYASHCLATSPPPRPHLPSALPAFPDHRPPSRTGARPCPCLTP